MAASKHLSWRRCNERLKDHYQLFSADESDGIEKPPVLTFLMTILIIVRVIGLTTFLRGSRATLSIQEIFLRCSKLVGKEGSTSPTSIISQQIEYLISQFLKASPGASQMITQRRKLSQLNYFSRRRGGLI